MIPPRMVTLALSALLVSSALAACSDRSSTPAGPGDEDGVQIVALSNFAFGPGTITIDRGTTIRWRNGTSTFHTVTPDGHDAFQEWETNGQGQTFEARFDEPGRYLYHCEPHRTLGMIGVIEVR